MSSSTMAPALTSDDEALRQLSSRRWRRAVVLTLIMLTIYFGFIALGAYNKELMGSPIVAGLSVGILLGALVIVSAFVLTGVYVAWANAHYDPELAAIRARILAATGAAAVPPGKGGAA